MSSDEQSDKECPLCMEALDDDINFFPCACRYQICRFCWHRLRTDENGLCPACRQPYPEDPVSFQPLSSAEIQKIKIEKKRKQLQQKNKLSENKNRRDSQKETPGSFNFFLDLYDEIGFDPFSESSKALADLLEEERMNSGN